MYTAGAQSTIFNVPSTDTVEKKRAYVEADFISHLNKFSNGGYETCGVRAVYGLESCEAAEEFNPRLTPGVKLSLNFEVRLRFTWG